MEYVVLHFVLRKAVSLAVISFHLAFFPGFGYSCAHIMPITKGAKKAHRASLRKRVFNLRRRRGMHDAVKEVRDLLGSNQTAEAEQKLPEAYKAIDKAAKRGVIKDNTAARKKSRLVAAIQRTKQS